MNAKSIIKLAFLLTLIGSAFRFFLFDTPLRILLWNEAVMQPILSHFGIQWESIANSLLFDRILVWTGKVIATYLSICALILIVKKELSRNLVLIITFLFLFFSILNWMDNFFHLPYLLEQSIFCFTGWIYLMEKEQQTSFKFIKLLIALTFIGHGLYAMNIYNIPGEFVQLTMNSTGFVEKDSIVLLKIIGIFDILFSLFLFSKNKKIVVIGLIYCIIWGITTAISRLIGHYHLELGIHSLDEYWHECIIRIPNGLVPLYLLVKLRFKSFRISH